MIKNEAHRCETVGFFGEVIAHSGKVAGRRFADRGLIDGMRFRLALVKKKDFGGAMITSVLFLVVAVTAFFLSWYFMRYTKSTRGPGSWAMDRLLVFLAGAFFCFSIVMAMAALKLFLLRS